MSPTRLTWILPLIWTLVTAAPAQAQAEAKPPANEPSAKPSPGDALLDQAIAKLGNLEWLDTHFEQVFQATAIKTTASGRLVLASKEHKLHYELKVRIADATASSQVACDGQTVWRVVTNRTLPPVVFKFGYDDLQAARSNIDRSQLDPQKIDNLLRDIEEEIGFAGIVPMLRDLRQGMTFPQVASATLADGTPVSTLEGRWLPATRDKLIEGTLTRHGVQMREEDRPRYVEAWEKGQGFNFLPRLARVYLAQDTLLPRQIEWHGPSRPGGDNVLLSRLTFKVSTTRPNDAAATAQLFTIAADLQKKAQTLDPKAILAASRDRLAKQEQMLQELNRSQPLDPGRGGRP